MSNELVELLREAAHELSRPRAPYARHLRERLEAAAASLEAQEPVGYTPAQIAWELERTALGDGYYGNALRVAKYLTGVTAEDRSLLDRYATGTQTRVDHVALQDLALRIDRDEAPQQGGGDDE